MFNFLTFNCLKGAKTCSNEFFCFKVEACCERAFTLSIKILLGVTYHCLFLSKCFRFQFTTFTKAVLGCHGETRLWPQKSGIRIYFSSFMVFKRNKTIATWSDTKWVVSCFGLVHVLVLEFLLSSRVYLMPFSEYSSLAIVRC